MPLKTVLITGCGSNSIGSALAKEFHMRGHRVFATGRSANEMDHELSILGMQTFPLDVTSEKSISEAVTKVSAATDGRLDILINSAGLMHIMPFADTHLSDVRSQMEVNVIGVWAVTHASLPLLLEAKGLVVNFGSVNEVFCPPFFAAYNASKAAVEAMGRTIRRELGLFGVRVVTLKTGSVKSSLFANAPAIVLPERSLYAPVRDWIEGRGFTASGRFMDVDEYSRAVVTDLLREDVRPVIWRGGLVWVAWFISWLGWETIMDQALIKGNHLHKLRYTGTAEGLKSA
ncbi:short-chain dehydrogenase/reductase [Coniochaeta sp. 2T2.1]|nr:short-chain dehydrogenase/reductase [Coniochaeta sp. 2T2.1]